MDDLLVERIRRFHIRHVTDARQNHLARTGDAAGEHVGHREEVGQVALPGDHQRRSFDFA